MAMPPARYGGWSGWATLLCRCSGTPARRDDAQRLSERPHVAFGLLHRVESVSTLVGRRLVGPAPGSEWREAKLLAVTQVVLFNCAYAVKRKTATSAAA